MTLPARNRLSSLLLLVMIICCSVHAAAKRKDIVIMKNGDRLSGEVKKLEGGVLYIDTDYVSGSIAVDWLQVDSVQSTGGFQVTLKDGERAAGTIEKSTEDQAPGRDFEIHTTTGEIHAAGPDVVNIESKKQSFWRQLTGAIDVGADFTSGNNQTSVSSDLSANYLSTKWMGGVSFTSAFSGQSGASKTNLIEVQTLDGLFLSGNSLLVGLGDFLHSSQQDLALRATLGGGYGRYILRSNQNTLAWIAGAVFTHENFEVESSRPSDQNIEALLGLQYQLFHFDRYQLQSQLLVYPGLSDAGRVRTTTKTTFTVKLSNNFHTDFSFWDNFDSRPPTTAKGNELGISNSLGWTF